MGESIQVIKLPLNNIVSLGSFKEYDISCYYKLLIDFIIEMISFGGIGIPQEDTFQLLAPSLFLCTLGIKA